MGDNRTEDLKREIASQITTKFNNQIDEVLSMCESEIEKVMLLQFYLYFSDFKVKYNWLGSNVPYWKNRFDKIEFIDEEVYLYVDPDTSKEEIGKVREEIHRQTNRVNRHKYRKSGPGIYQKYIGFRVIDGASERFSATGDNADVPGSEVAFREFEIFPQYPVNIDGKEYRLDIAVIMKRRDWRKHHVIETRKVALECDGYDYHSSPEQKRNDDIRTRKLKKSGWKEVLRYSGKELHSIRGKKEINLLFDEIIEVLYI